MLKNIFRKKKYKVVKEQSDRMEFLGSPFGEDTERLENDISERLETVSAVRGAYLSMLRYADNENVRLALIIQSDFSKDDFIASLAKSCAGVVTMDIMFMEDFSEHECLEIIGKCKKFYIS
ncbi:MAG: enhanced serine sensitivity protein SseB C-terminal domain-containing protein [Hellea sp.]